MVYEIAITAIWLSLVTYSIWFLFRAKTFQPLTLDNLALQWKLHKQKTGCSAKFLQSMIKKDNKIVGFSCECGYEFLQKRLITQRIPN